MLSIAITIIPIYIYMYAYCIYLTIDSRSDLLYNLNIHIYKFKIYH